MREAHFCPMCGHPLIEQAVHGRLRPVCQQCGHIVYFDPKVAVVVMIVQDEQVLLVQRAIDPEMGRWALPAGFVEYDEPPADAAVREVQEETGLQVELMGVLEVFPKRDNGLANIVIAYGARIVGGELQAGDDAGQVAWFTRQSVPPVAFYPSQTLIGEWIRGER